MPVVLLGHDHAVIDDLGVLDFPFFKTSATDGVLVVTLGSGLVFVACKVPLIILFHLVDVGINFFTVWPSSLVLLFNPFSGKASTYKYPTYVDAIFNHPEIRISV